MSLSPSSPSSFPDSLHLLRKLAVGGLSPFFLTASTGGAIVSNPDGAGSDAAASGESFPVGDVHPEDFPALERAARAAAADSASRFQLDYRLRSGRGGWVWERAFGSVDEVTPEGAVRISGFRSRHEEEPKMMLRRSRLDEAVLRGLPGMYLVLDEKGAAIHWNDLFAETFFEPSEARDTHRLFDAVRGEFFGFVAAVRTKGVGRIEAWLKKRDGALGRFQCLGRLLSLGGEPRLICLLTDVTEHHKTKLALRLERARLDTLIDAARLGTWDLDAETKTVAYNHRWVELYGLKPEEVSNSPDLWEKYIHPDDRPGVQDAVDAHVEGKTPYYSAQYRVVRPNGVVAHMQDYGRVVSRSEDGKNLRFMGGIQDITALKEAQAELLRSKTHLEIVIEQTGIGLWDLDVRTERVRSHPSVFIRQGYSEEELPRTYEDLVTFMYPGDGKRFLDNLFACIEKKTENFTCEWRMRQKDETYVWFLTRGYPVERDKHGRAVRLVGSHFNIQSVKEQAENERKSLKIIARQKSELEYSVAERTRLLDRVQSRLQEILAEGAISAVFPEPGTKTFSRSKGGAFERSLNHAFDLITENMRWYRRILENIPSPILVTDNAERCIYMNRAGLDVVGAVNLNEVIGKPCDEWPDDSCRLSPSLIGDLRQPFEVFHPRLNRHFRSEISSLFGPAGEVVGTIQVMADVTEARTADERARIMLESMPLACGIWDEDGNLLDCNEAAVELFEAPDRETFIRDFVRFSPPARPEGASIQEVLKANMPRTLEEGEVHFFWEHITYTGKHLPMRVTLRRADTPGERIVVSSAEDLRKLRAKEVELDQERRLLRNVMDSSPVCFVIQVNGLVRFATRYAQQFFDMRVGDRLGNFFTTVTEHRRFLREVQETGAVNWRVGTMRAADGSSREMLINAFSAEYYGESCVMSWLMDVSDMRNKERELSQARDLAEASTRAKSSFLANMSHEIRTPMNAILGMTRLALDSRLPHGQRKRLEKVEMSATALLRVLNDILDFSKIEAGKLEMENLTFDPRRELERVIDLTRPSALEKGLALNLRVDDDVPRNVVGDSLRIGQILTNLLSNAVKFTEAGQVDVHVSVAKFSKKTAWVCYRVKDTGIGLDDEQLATLFSAFTQADSSTTRRYGGTGLGLAISRKLAELMNGTLSCSGRPGEGAEFSFTVPLPVLKRVGMAECAPSAPQADFAGLPERLKGLRVLLAEDNELNRLIAREMLERIGFVVDEAVDGREAVRMAKRNTYAAVFMDIQMPGMDGFAATASLRRVKKLRNLPIIAITAHAMVGDEEQSLSAGMDGHLTKPLDEEKLCRTVARLIPKKSDSRPKAQDAEKRPPAAVDHALGLRIMGGKRGLYHRLLERLAQELPKIMEGLAGHMVEGRAEQAALAAHTLKGSAGNLGAGPLRAAAAALEAALRMGDAATASGLLEEVKRAAAGYKRTVTQILRREDAGAVDIVKAK